MGEPLSLSAFLASHPERPAEGLGAELMARVPPAHQPVIAARIATYRASCTVLQLIGTTATMKQLFAEMENYAGSELDPEYP